MKDIARQNPKSADKLKALWIDDRSYWKRLVLSLIVTFGACFTFLFFGPIEITAFGQNSLSFTVLNIAPVMAVFTIIVFLVISLILSIFKGKIYNYLITAVFSFLLCGYIQGNLLNGNLGALNGDTIFWHTQKYKMLLNIIIWLVVFLASYLILYFRKDVWKNTLRFVSIALVIMQTVALISIITGNSAETLNKEKGYLSNADLTTYSSKKNTLVFVLDRLDYDYIDEVLENDPAYFNELDGFTQYTNATSEHARTKPALNYILTSCENGLWKKSVNDFFNDSWKNNGNNILSDLNSAKYTIDVYTEFDNMFGDNETAKNYVSNYSYNSNTINPKVVIRNLTYLSAYRYAPTTVKPFFWCYTDDVNKDIFKSNSVYEVDETMYINRISNFTADKNTNYFKFYHFNGSHPPYTLNEDGTKNTDQTSSLAQTKGSFRILYSAFKKMKESGIYKDATIIITADHGIPVSDTTPLQKANRIGLFYKPSGSADTPLKTSHAPVSNKNIPATIVKSAGLDYSKYGKAIDEVGEDENVTRVFYKSIINDQGKEVEFYTYDITGDAADFNNWKITGQTNVENYSCSFY